MAWPRSKTKAYLAEYAADSEYQRTAAILIESLLKEILADPTLEIHLITCRPKSIESARLKLYEKRYRNPKRELTDAFGARIITYYSEDVDRVVDKLSESLRIDKVNSEDKRSSLDLKEFGYKSVHLQAQTNRSWATNPKYSSIRNRWFEIQVRSILEHAWAEIEHEIVYKSEVDYPATVKRRFARIAGTIELLEEEFIDLRKEKDNLIDKYKGIFQSGIGRHVSLDCAKMIGLLEVEESGLRGWRRASQEGRPFEMKSDMLCAMALRAARVRSPHKLRRILRSKRFEKAVRIIANRGEEITHYAQILIAVAITSKAVFYDYFPLSKIYEMLNLKPNA